MRNQLIASRHEKSSTKYFGIIYNSKDIEQWKIKVDKFLYDINIYFSILGLTFYSFEIPNKDVLQLNTHSEVEFTDGKNTHSMSYLLLGKYAFLLSTRFRRVEGKDLCYYLYQSRGNTTKLAVREPYPTDSFTEKIKIALAFILAYLKFWDKSIVLFEKDSAKYEESASIVFEKLIDKGLNNAYFILSKDGFEKYKIPKKYHNNVIEKYTFKHYLKLFQAKLILSTETHFHSINRFTLNKFFHLKLRYLNDHNFVFLQHGVMYMVALDSPTRTAFKPSSWLGREFRVVVSSELEARHFIDKADYKKEHLYITGLPKYDKNRLNSNPDKIIIMPTWRPWEENQAKLNPTATSYYRMLGEILSGIPKELHEKIQMLPHPHFKEVFNTTPLSRYIPENIIYDQLLQNCKVLITDYSSISYDAFYRGSNIIFWWKEKDQIMKEQYQSELLLNEDKVFGKVVFDSTTLNKALPKAYVQEGRDQQYIKNYQEIVQFNDNQNTERLIHCLEQDDYI